MESKVIFRRTSSSSEEQRPKTVLPIGEGLLGILPQCFVVSISLRKFNVSCILVCNTTLFSPWRLFGLLQRGQLLAWLDCEFWILLWLRRTISLKRFIPVFVLAFCVCRSLLHSLICQIPFSRFHIFYHAVAPVGIFVSNLIYRICLNKTTNPVLLLSIEYLQQCFATSPWNGH